MNENLILFIRRQLCLWRINMRLDNWGEVDLNNSFQFAAGMIQVMRHEEWTGFELNVPMKTWRLNLLTVLWRKNSIDWEWRKLTKASSYTICILIAKPPWKYQLSCVAEKLNTMLQAASRDIDGIIEESYQVKRMLHLLLQGNGNVLKSSYSAVVSY